MSPPALTLARFFRDDFAPIFLLSAAPRTFEAYETTLRVWSACTDDPPLADVTVKTLAEFKRRGLERRGRHGARSPATVNRDLRHVLHLLSKAGPPSPRNRDALGLLPSVPWCKPLRIDHELPRSVTLDEIARAYQACHVSISPRVVGVSPESWWQAFIVAGYNLAARVGSLLCLRWADVDLAGATITVRAAADKCGRARQKPINDTLRAHLLRIRSRDDRVFPCPLSRWGFHCAWRRIARAAGVTLRLHDLKRAAATEASAIADPFAVQLFCDHAHIATTQKHYINPASRLARVAADLPQPEGFSCQMMDRQLRLFA